MNESTLLRVRQIAADVFRSPLEEIQPTSSPDSVKVWNSLNHLTFVVALETEFKVELTPEEVAEILTIELASMLIQEKCGSSL